MKRKSFTMTTEPKIKKSLCKRLLVVAIDVGTTYSAFAFSFSIEPFNLKCNSSWNASTCCLQSMKTPTVLLLDENKKFVAFGYEAEERYDELVEDGIHGNYYFCRWFKMSLHTSVIMDINYKIKDDNGKEVEALIVFSESIKYLKKEAEDLINKRGFLEEEINTFDVDWVLTVPAMWTDAAKQFMRKAAEEAGIKDENLKMALEPEAASVLYMHMDCIKTNTTKNQGQIDRGFKCGAKYLVVDMGGGTVDITLHQVVDETSLEELVPPCGGHWGGTTVDDNYLRFLEGIVGKDVFKRFAEEEHGLLLDMCRDFERQKRAFYRGCDESRDNTKRKMSIKVPCTLVRTMKKMYPAKNIDNLIEKDDTLKGKVTWKKDRITITSDIFASFFETCLEGTINEIEGVFSNFANIEAILLVGGCAESPLIHTKVKSRFPNKKVIVAEDAGFAVLKGAVIYGHFPNIIVSRVARHSYGIRVYRDFNPGQHPGDELVVIGNKRKCKDVFAVHVKKGQKLQVGEVQSSQRYTRLQRDQKSLIFDFFTSTSENPEYVTDPGCEALGQLEVELDPCSRSVFVWLKYGGTELEAECFDEVTGKKTKATFKFLKE